MSRLKYVEKWVQESHQVKARRREALDQTSSLAGAQVCDGVSLRWSWDASMRSVVTLYRQ
jgi:hypothetical protein